MPDSLTDFGSDRSRPFHGLALAAITAFSNGDESAVEAVMADASDYPLELFIAQTSLASTLVAVLATSVDESPEALLQCLALLIAQRNASGAPPFPDLD
jgi:hypothetical protein